jgi:hypothetical protein
MASNTPYYFLYMKDPSTDGNDSFNIKTMLNENWEKIDAALKNLDTGKMNKSGGNITGDLIFDNDKSIYGKNTDGIALHNLIKISAANKIDVGTAARPLVLHSAVTPEMDIGGTLREIWHDGNSAFPFKTINGYVKLKNGWILQWGRNVIEAQTPTNNYGCYYKWKRQLSFPSAFQNECFVVLGSYESPVGWGIALKNATNSKVYFDLGIGANDASVISGDNYVSWIAIGW